ncbi:MAG: zinc-binding dehydrogenase [Actinobacteria bacterium]|nr:zinc-binding dehydrogenase [Actinomycetota bacterium]
MRAVKINNNELEIVSQETPQPGPDDVVIEVRAAGLNAADLLQRRGFYPAPPGWPSDIPGLECAGVVHAVGLNVTSVSLGDRVAAIVGGGGQATHCVVPAEHLIAVPSSITDTEAGGFAEAFTTAFDALVLNAHIAPNERVLISGAAGGVGLAAIQIARAFGAIAVAVTRDDRHHDALRDLGASECVTIDQVGTIADVDVILELVGAAHLAVAQTKLRPFGRVVVIGVGSGGRVEVDLLGLMSRRASLTGSTLRARSREEKATIAREVNEQLVPLWASGALRVVVSEALPLEQAREAYDLFAQPGKLGKIVLVNEA